MSSYWSMLSATAGLEFDEPTHTYTYRGERMESVTTVLKSLCEEFDEQFHSARIAERDGTTPEEVREKWAAKRDHASAMGDYVHAIAERVAWDLRDRAKFTVDLGVHPEPWLPKLRGMWRWYMDHLEITQGLIFPELKVVWPEYRIAGTVDLVVGSYEGVPTIADWKTNQSIDIQGYRNMKPPFTRGKCRLPDSNFWTYALQLNMYRRIMMERYDYEAERLVLVHLPGYGKYVEYDVPIMDAHIDKILELRNVL